MRKVVMLSLLALVCLPAIAETQSPNNDADKSFHQADGTASNAENDAADKAPAFLGMKDRVAQHQKMRKEFWAIALTCMQGATSYSAAANCNNLMRNQANEVKTMHEGHGNH